MDVNFKYAYTSSPPQARSVVISDIQNRDAMLHLMAIQYSLNRWVNFLELIRKNLKPPLMN